MLCDLNSSLAEALGTFFFRFQSCSQPSVYHYFSRILLCINPLIQVLHPNSKISHPITEAESSLKMIITNQCEHEWLFVSLDSLPWCTLPPALR